MIAVGRRIEMTEVAGERMRLYEGAELEAMIGRMARQALSALDGESPPLIVGVLRRGAPLADRLLAAMQARHPGYRADRLDLKVKRYSDDLKLLHADTHLEHPGAAADLIRGREVLVVDDVLYQGHSLFRVFEFLRAQGAASVRAAVLADRCVVQLPVKADVVGAYLQIAAGDVVECSVPPYEPEFAIDLLRPTRG
jgi:pyrimidine operon attenuation protein/uracil phosphoribosyltransferase